MAQTVARRARARARARIRERELVKAEALRLAAERKLVKRAAALAELRTALKLEAPSSSGPALKFWAARLRADDDDDAATEDVDEKKAREAFAAGAHDGTVMKSENLEEALAAAGLSQNESDVAAAFGELGGKDGDHVPGLCALARDEWEEAEASFKFPEAPRRQEAQD